MIQLYLIKDTLASEKANFQVHGKNEWVSLFDWAGIEDFYPVSENPMTSSLIT